MSLDVLLRLEEKIDQLLLKKQQLEDDCLRLHESKEQLVQERDFIAQELDRILARLDMALDQETS
jgi:cell division protein ZapB